MFRVNAPAKNHSFSSFLAVRHYLYISPNAAKIHHDRLPLFSPRHDRNIDPGGYDTIHDV
jgi:hypothetical protein